MKLRLQSNSLRLRLKQGEVERLVKTGRVEEKIVMGSSPEETLQYVLESSEAISGPQAWLKKNKILVQVPPASVSRWALSDEIGIEAMITVADGQLQVLIEKDFACLNGTEEQNADAFPNPLAGTKC